MLDSSKAFTKKNITEIFQKFFECPDALLDAARREDPELLKIVKDGYRERISRLLTTDYLERRKADLIEKGITVIAATEQNFPRELSENMLLLYCKGNLSLLNSPCIGMVGSRNCSQYGADCARKFANAFTNAGITIVSGLADGVDGISHAAALDAGGNTIAVLGCGLDYCYPQSNLYLQKRIAKEGLLVSGYYPDTKPFPYMFAERNEIISALSKALVLIEAGEKSGSLITASCSAAMLKPVFTLAGNIFSPLMAGSISLVDEEIAECVVSPKKVLAFFGKEYVRHEDAPVFHSKRQEKLFHLIKKNPMDFDGLIQASRMDYQTLSEELMDLELSGYVERTATNVYKEKIR